MSRRSAAASRRQLTFDGVADASQLTHGPDQILPFHHRHRRGGDGMLGSHRYFDSARRRRVQRRHHHLGVRLVPLMPWECTGYLQHLIAAIISTASAGSLHRWPSLQHREFGRQYWTRPRCVDPSVDGTGSNAVRDQRPDQRVALSAARADVVAAVRVPPDAAPADLLRQCRSPPRPASLSRETGGSRDKGRRCNVSSARC